jgi:hypothetical protein
MDCYRANRQYERLVFDGVPDHPETIYQRSTYSHVDERVSQKALYTDDTDLYEESEDEEVIATIVFQPQLEQIKIIREDNKQKEIIV